MHQNTGILLWGVRFATVLSLVLGIIIPVYAEKGSIPIFAYDAINSPRLANISAPVSIENKNLAYSITDQLTTSSFGLLTLREKDTVASGSTILVNTTTDEDADNSFCSLREAITAANTNTPYKGCITGSGADVINVPLETYTLSSALPTVTTIITIQGTGTEKTVLQASACNPVIDLCSFNFPAFSVSGGDLTLDNFIVRHFYNNLCAICVSSGMATFNNDSILNNKSRGIRNIGAINVTYSTISQNISDSDGGGIYNSGTAHISNSTISNNSSTSSSGGSGGGIYNSGSIDISNSTISYNSTTYFGGGILNSSTAELYNSTISNNNSHFGNGIYNEGGDYFSQTTLTIINSTLVGNALPTDLYTLYSSGSYINVSISNSIIANPSGGGSCSTNSLFVVNSNNLIQDGNCSPKYSGDPNLGPLSDHGGPTMTIALLTSPFISPAIDTGDSSVCGNWRVGNKDQRGYIRPQGSVCDIGAFELENPIAIVTQAPGQTDPTNITPIQYAIKFNEIVTGFDGTDIAFSGSTAPGTLSASVTGTGADYIVSATGVIGDGTVKISIPANSVLDADGNGNAISTPQDNFVNFDLTKPTAIISQAAGQIDPTYFTPIRFAVVYSEPVIGFENGDILFTGSTNSGNLNALVTGSGADYTVSVSGMVGIGTVVISVPQNSVNDLAGNPNEASTRIDNSVSFDPAPTVTVSKANSQPDPAGSGPIAFIVTFSEPVFGFQNSDLSFIGSTALGTLTATISGSGPSYNVLVTGMTDTGKVLLSIPSNVVEDNMGYPNNASVGIENSVYYDVSDIHGEWQITGSMNVGRSGHTATLLNNGKVLVAGGYNTSGDLSSAELFDPVKGTWNITGSMNEKRYGHSATLLPNGTVLVIGGRSTYCGIKTAEIYDPSTGTWQITSAMNTARYWHTATLMANGNVLVAGGKDCGALASVEIYDTITSVWRAISPMNNARYEHTATMLKNGKIFVVAGNTYTTELFNPVSESWIITSPVINYDNMHSAILLRNGKILIAGGSASASNCAKIYDPLSDSWTRLACGKYLTDYFSVTLLDNGMILGAGGEWGTNTERSQLFDQMNGVWSTTALMNYERHFHTATLLQNGSVLVSGGYNYFNQEKYLSTSEIFIKPVTVKITQADGQIDPTRVSRIDFLVTFSEAVSGFDSSDISLTRSTVPGNLTTSISGTGPTYQVSVTGMTGNGKIVISIPGNVVQDIYGKFSNMESTNIDNVVAYNQTSAIFIPYVKR